MCDEPVDQSDHRRQVLSLANQLLGMPERARKNFLRRLAQADRKLKTQVCAELERLRERL